MSKHPCTYILASTKNGTLYIGVTSNLTQRIWQHKNNEVKGFTEKYHVHMLVYYEQHGSMEAAITREKQLKKMEPRMEDQVDRRREPQLARFMGYRAMNMDSRLHGNDDSLSLQKGFTVRELKTTDFEPEHAGKLNFYIKAVDELLRSESDQATIGILLCKKKDRLVAEYALSDIQKPMGVSEYQLTQSLPENFQSKLPSIEDLEQELAGDL